MEKDLKDPMPELGSTTRDRAVAIARGVVGRSLVGVQFSVKLYLS